jgi:STE24 endopeptidase
MPWPFLLALILAFGLDDVAGSPPLPRSVALIRFGWFAGAFGTLVLVAWLVGSCVAARIDRGRLEPRLVRWFHRIALGLDWLALAVFAWGIFVLGWPRIVGTNLRLRSSILIDDLTTLLPYVLCQVAVWAALSPAEARLRFPHLTGGESRHLWLRLRQALGLALPILLLYGLGRDCARRWAAELAQDPVVQVIALMVMAAMILLLAPAFVRIALPTRPLPRGLLRDRLEALGRRFGFKCSDILVWDTGGTIVNAGVTGALPGFRYVLLSDALIERLGPTGIEAVYGHELGHVVHKHLAFFGLFFLGSIGLISVLDGLVQSFLDGMGWQEPFWGDSDLGIVAGWLGAVVVLGAYFVLVFGFLSRRFERQADVFGCRAVSCDRPDCPPHLDPNSLPASPPAQATLCPVGIRSFAEALATVAALNGLSFHAPSWRHGSIAKRIAFLERLAKEPRELTRFQAHIRRLRVALALALVLATVVAVVASQTMLPLPK